MCMDKMIIMTQSKDHIYIEHNGTIGAGTICHMDQDGDTTEA